jgi:hypothetical protein
VADQHRRGLTPGANDLARSAAERALMRLQPQGEIVVFTRV